MPHQDYATLDLVLMRRMLDLLMKKMLGRMLERVLGLLFGAAMLCSCTACSKSR